jgi:hypothetical protein
MATAKDETAAATRPKGLQPHLDDKEEDEPISTKATDCESNFSKSLQHMESLGEKRYVEILRKLQVRFADWMAYLGVFAGGKASLDQRLRRHPRYRDLVLLALDMLNMNLTQSKARPRCRASMFMIINLPNVSHSGARRCRVG